MSGPAATPVTTFWRLAGMTYLQVRIVAIFVVLEKKNNWGQWATPNIFYFINKHRRFSY
jgi:hypothetical protein